MSTDYSNDIIVLLGESLLGLRITSISMRQRRYAASIGATECVLRHEGGDT